MTNRTSPPTLPPRDSRGHKGSFGTVGVIGGVAGAPRVMIGGPALTALAALRSGCGLAVLAVPAPIMAAAITIAPSATGFPLPVDEDADGLDGAAAADRLEGVAGAWSCLAAGPGWGAGAGQRIVLDRLLATGDAPIVIDADAINTLAVDPSSVAASPRPLVVTPHPGEYRRLALALDLDGDAVTPDRRPEAARQLAERLGGVVVLKGPSTVVSDGQEVWINATGCAALATAGTGDVLTGMIAGFIAQFVASGQRSVFDRARAAVHLHGAAADAWAEARGTAGMLASDLLDHLPAVIAAARA